MINNKFVYCCICFVKWIMQLKRHEWNIVWSKFLGFIELFYHSSPDHHDYYKGRSLISAITSLIVFFFIDKLKKIGIHRLTGKCFRCYHRWLSFIQQMEKNACWGHDCYKSWKDCFKAVVLLMLYSNDCRFSGIIILFSNVHRQHYCFLSRRDQSIDFQMIFLLIQMIFFLTS